MSYTNEAGQTVNVGDRVAYAYYQGGHLTVGRVVGFSAKGNPQIEVEGRFVDMVRSRYNADVVRVKHSTSPIWERKPYTHYRHKVTGWLMTDDEWQKLPRPEWNHQTRSYSPSPRDEWEYDTKGQLESRWVEFKVPARFTPVCKERVVVIEAAQA